MTTIIVTPTTPRQITVSPVAPASVNEVVIGVGKGGSVGATGATGATEIITVYTVQREIYPLVGQSRIYFEAGRTIYKIRASLGTPPTGSAAVITAYVNGSSIGSISIAAGSHTSALTVSVAVQEGDYLTVSVISVGATTPGSDLTVTFNLN